MIPAVWAPIPSRVRLLADGAISELTRGDDGWWRGTADLQPGTRYGFLVDDDPEPLWDPRGLSLPDGVHGLSEVMPIQLEVSANWHGKTLQGSSLYELHIGTFTDAGTLDSAIDRLDHLVHLGVDFVELLPVNAFNGDHNWGYDGVAWYAVQQSYGGPDAYRRFVEAAHARGLGVIQDVVYNHLGPSGNVLPRFGPYLRSDSASPWGDAIALDQPEVRRYVLDNARMWFERYGVDGLRLDAVHALVDDSPVHVLAELSAETEALSARLGRPLTLIAESDLNDPVMILPRDQGGYGLTAQWSDDYHHAVHAALTGESDGYYGDFATLSALEKAATHGFVHDGGWSSFRGRPHGSPIPFDVPSWRLVTFSQDHDQIGNRAAGDRLSQSLSPRRLAIAAVLTVCSPFTPMIFMGEEWAAATPWQYFTSHPEPDLARAVAEGRVAEFAAMGWNPDEVPDPQNPATFQRSHLDWSEPEHEPHRTMLALYRELLALRRRTPEFAEHDFGILSAESDDATGRFLLRQDALSIWVNLGNAPWTLPEAGLLLLATDAAVTASDAPLVLPPDTAAVVRNSFLTPG